MPFNHVFLYETVISIIIFINLSIIIIDISLISSGKEYNKYDIFKKVFSPLSGVLLSFFSVLLSSNVANNNENLSFCDRLKRFKDDELKSRSHDVLKKVAKIYTMTKEKIEMESREPLGTKSHDDLQKFKTLVINNLLYRIGLVNYINLITFAFFYYNLVIYLVPIFNNENSDEIVIRRTITISTNIINQVFSVVFSYLSIVTDNVLFLNRICDLMIFSLDETKDFNRDEFLSFLTESSFFISNPLSIIWKEKSDLIREKENKLNNFMGSSIFGTPIIVTT